MEYIQCPHCDKKYGVNDKIRAATGKSIRCKQCSQPFEIIIHNANADPQPAPAPQPATPAPAAAPAADTSKEKAPTDDNQKNKPAAKKTKQPAKRNTQLIITIVLALLLIVAAGGGYIYLYQPQLVAKLLGNQQPADKQAIIPDQIVKPLEIMPASQAKNSAAAAAKSANNKPATPPHDSAAQPSETAKPATTTNPLATSEATQAESPPTKSAQPKPAQPKAQPASVTPARLPLPLPAATPAPHSTHRRAQQCKQELAAYWYRTNILTHSHINTDQYMALLGQNLDHTETIANICGDKSLIAKVVETAKANHKPGWIKADIDRLIEAATIRQQQAQQQAQPPANPANKQQPATP